MYNDKHLPESQYVQARLNGVPCDAMAWIQTTSLSILDGRGKSQTVEGIRKWRGKAVLKQAVDEFHFDSSVKYQGKLRHGEEEWDIDAEVFLYYIRRNKIPTTQDSRQEESEGTYVEFVGAGNPFGLTKVK